jgi:hypothetical protein
MTRVDKAAFLFATIAGLSAYLVWRNRDTAAAFIETARLKGTR